MKRTAWLGLALIAAGLSTGCVTRRVLITSEPPGAVVFRDGQPIGATPCEESFVYYGTYKYRLVKDGYQIADVPYEMIPPVYEYPGLDFIFENVLPFQFRDRHQVHVNLQPLEVVRHDDVRNQAEALRGRGQLIQRPANAPPRRERNTADTAVPQTAAPPVAPSTLPPPESVNPSPPFSPPAPSR
jgi:hypothetical protein